MTYNANGYAEPKRLVLGSGKLYANDQFVGNLKGAVTFSASREIAYQRPGHMVGDLKAEVIGEEVSLEAEVCDLKLDQLRIALGTNKALIEEARILKIAHQIPLVGTTPVLLSKTAVNGSVKVWKLDRSQVYAVTTDYTFGTNQVTRVPAGDIADGETVLVEYEYENADALVLGFGGEKCLKEFRIDYVVDSCGGASGMRWQLVIFRAIVPSELELAFNERASGDYTVQNVSFRALVDPTKPEGRNLYEFIEEDGAL